MDAKAQFDKLVEAIETDIPGFRIQFKTDSGIQKLISRLMFWMNTTDPETGKVSYPYMETFTTTLGKTVWYPSREFIEEDPPWKTLEHEWVHLKDSRTLFGLLPARLSFFNGLIYALIYITPGRAFVEIRGYRRTLELAPEKDREAYIVYIITQFTGPNYLWMWPFPSHIRKLLKKPSPYHKQMDNY